MQDETITSEATEQRPVDTRSEAGVLHYYIEVGGDLLAKPSALCDLIEAEGTKPCVVFCNTPSDADFIEVLLKKRGVRVRKLIGHISQAKLNTSIEQVRNEEVNVLVVTDVAAQGLRLRDFGLCIIHATHSDPEIYLERTGQTGDNEGGPAKVISLVGPLDITHFHYVKKIIQITIEKLELPDASVLAGARLERVKQDAMKHNAMNNEKIASLVRLIVEDPNKEDIVAYLLQNTLEVLPALSPSAESKEAPEDSRSGGRYSRERGERGDRGDRAERGSRGDRSRRGASSRNGRYSSRDEMGDESYSSRDGGGRRESRGGFAPLRKEIRIYIGQGSAQGFGKDQFIDILKNNSNTPVEEIKRFSERQHYCFVDLSEEFADSTVASLSGLPSATGQTLFLKKAIQIPVPREDDAVIDASADRNELSEEHGDSSDYTDALAEETRSDEAEEDLEAEI